MRGEQQWLMLICLMLLGSPPLARGTDKVLTHSFTFRGITPACAGNSRHWICAGLCRWDHPRLRGEQQCFKKSSVDAMGSPPLARGTAIYIFFHRLTPRITPACAGNRREAFCAAAVGKDHPRLRGEQTIKTYFTGGTGGSPPLARGTVSI